MTETPPLWTKVEHERDLYRRLLELGQHEEPGPFLAETLELVTRISGALRGYLELHDGADESPEASLWAIHGCEEDEAPAFRGGLSQGVIAEAITSRQTIVTTSAVADPRFRDRGSVRRHAIQAVLCAPILAGQRQGVIYLQGRDAPGPFSEEDRVRVETLARHIAAFADRLLLRQRYVKRSDPTLSARRILHAPELVGTSEALAFALREAALAVSVDASVLLTGPTGTGKKALARALHRSGARAQGPFVELGCAALPKENQERELADKITAADGGVLFLDEIDELAPAAQAALLHLLETGEYYPTGEIPPRRAALRVIAATSADLHAAAGRKAFREDLLYRLQAISIRMPTLAERVDDIPALVRDACARACARARIPRLDVSPAALVSAQTAEWPGNVRQLYQTIEAAVLRANAEDALRLESRHIFPAPELSSTAPATYQDATRQFQRRFVQQTLEDVGWNISEAARRLDVGRTYLYRLISTLGIERVRG